MGPRLAAVGLATAIAGCFAESPMLDTATATAASSDSGGGMCPDDLVPAGLDLCPDVCTGGCDSQHVCTIACEGTLCQDATVQCPAEYECEVICSGVDVCDGTTIACPPDLPYSTLCEGGADACGDTTIECGLGECSVQCGGTDQVCSGTKLVCSDGACLAECSGSSQPILENCDEACSCTPCDAM